MRWLYKYLQAEYPYNSLNIWLSLPCGLRRWKKSYAAQN